MSFIDDLINPGIDAIFGIQDEYKKDNRSSKVNLTAGIYLDEDKRPPAVMEAIKLAEQKLNKEETTKNYLSIVGDSNYLQMTEKLVLGDVDSSRIVKIQTIGGTSALSTGFHFLKDNGYENVSLSDPTWANHKQIVAKQGYRVFTYPYFDSIKNFEIFVDHLNSLPKKTICLLQARCHNPTGIDFSKEQWKIISKICLEKNLFPFFDSAYQGFADSLEEDNWVIRYFFEQGHEMFVAHSYSKSFALYNERVGALFVCIKDPGLSEVVKRHISKIIRVNYSNPPSHGSSTIKYVLNDGSLYQIWIDELSKQRNRINDIRKRFADKIKPIFGKELKDQIMSGRGFFCMLPLTKEQIHRLKVEFGVYMTNSGRISLPGLTMDCIDYVVQSIEKVKG
ncbi:MAG: Aspartate aminotransferase [Chlamydiia bacterium]|nr:Aspartate aminotransferase [Chlamydiia bacterium]